MSRVVAVLLSLGLSVLFTGPAAVASPEGDGCPPAFDIGRLTLDEAADLLLRQGVPASRDEVLARLAEVDRNADRRLCFKDLPDTPGIAPYAYNYRDNRRS